jgi:hypothetical protein
MDVQAVNEKACQFVPLEDFEVYAYLAELPFLKKIIASWLDSNLRISGIKLAEIVDRVYVEKSILEDADNFSMILLLDSEGETRKIVGAVDENIAMNKNTGLIAYSSFTGETVLDSLFKCDQMDIKIAYAVQLNSRNNSIVVYFFSSTFSLGTYFQQRKNFKQLEIRKEITRIKELVNGL